MSSTSKIIPFCTLPCRNTFRGFLNNDKMIFTLGHDIIIANPDGSLVQKNDAGGDIFDVIIGDTVIILLLFDHNIKIFTFDGKPVSIGQVYYPCKTIFGSKNASNCHDYFIVPSMGYDKNPILTLYHFSLSKISSVSLQAGMKYHTIHQLADDLCLLYYQDFNIYDILRDIEESESDDNIEENETDDDIVENESVYDILENADRTIYLYDKMLILKAFHITETPTRYIVETINNLIIRIDDKGKIFILKIFSDMLDDTYAIIETATKYRVKIRSTPNMNSQNHLVYQDNDGLKWLDMSSVIAEYNS
jgi:hypothetical protein